MLKSSIGLGVFRGRGKGGVERKEGIQGKREEKREVIGRKTKKSRNFAKMYLIICFCSYYFYTHIYIYILHIHIHITYTYIGILNLIISF